MENVETIELIVDKDDLINMFMGLSPNYEAMESNSKYGNYSASYGTWTWNKDALNKLNTAELVRMYRTFKRSWKSSKDDDNNKPEIIDNDHTRIVLLQHDNLRTHFQKLIKEVLGQDYYNEGMDVYMCDEFSCRDLKSKLSRK